MHPKVERRTRRVHGAEIKSKVLAECRRPGASVSAVALAHGLNTNLVRKWMQGRGLQRAGLKADNGQVARAAPEPTPLDGAARLQFVPVQVRASSDSIDQAIPAGRSEEPIGAAEAAIHIELRHGSSQVAVHWPPSQAAQCAAWLRELTAAVLK